MSATATLPRRDGWALSGLRLRYLHAGDPAGPPVVCLHGIGSNATVFGAQLGGLDGFRVVAWNAPGYAGSEPLPWEEPAAVSYAEAVVGLLDALGIDRAHLIGSSLGSLIAVEVAAGWPDRVRSLTCTAPANGSGRDPAERAASLARRRALINLDRGEYARTRTPDLVASRDPDLLATVSNMAMALDTDAYLQAAHALAGGDALTTATRVRAPALVLVGAEDTVTPADTSARPLARALGNAPVETFPGCAHLLELEAPTRFNRVVTDFLRAH